MQASLSAYKQCLTEHTKDASECEAASRAFEADLQVYNAAMGNRAVTNYYTINSGGGGGSHMDFHNTTP